MKIASVQYDSGGEWLDVRFDDGRGFRFDASFLAEVAECSDLLADVLNGDGAVKELAP